MTKYWFTLLLFAFTASAEDNDILRMATMCAAAQAVVSTNMADGDYKETMHDESLWWFQFTTDGAVRKQMLEFEHVLKTDWERAWPLTIQLSQACTSTKEEADPST